MGNSSNSLTKISKSPKGQKGGEYPDKHRWARYEATHALVYNHETGQVRSSTKKLKGWEGANAFFMGSRWEGRGEVV
jgi:hypothetical protein